MSDLAHIALVEGQPVNELPQDLYIPPDALEIFLETFEGPLDLLLYLIKKQNLDVLDIPVAKITEQYMQYITLMDVMKFELAAEYLLMAAMLAEIKSRMLLPRPQSEEGDEDDPRAELVRRLQEYERYKQVAEEIDELPRMQREIFATAIELPEFKSERPLPDIDMKELLLAFRDVLMRAEMFSRHHVQREALSVRERMSNVLLKLRDRNMIEFTELFEAKEGRAGAVVSFLALLELIKDSLIDVVQSEPYAPIYIKPAQSQEANAA